MRPRSAPTAPDNDHGGEFETTSHYPPPLRTATAMLKDFRDLVKIFSSSPTVQSAAPAHATARCRARQHGLTAPWPTSAPVDVCRNHRSGNTRAPSTEANRLE